MSVKLVLRWEDDDENSADFYATTFLRLGAEMRENGYLGDGDTFGLAGLASMAEPSVADEPPSSRAVAEAADAAHRRGFHVAAEYIRPWGTP